MKKVLIASRNPVKINATKKAFEEVFTDRFEFEGVSADSLVSDQPMQMPHNYYQVSLLHLL